MSAAGLYRYFDGRDALLTRLIVDGYDDLADHLLVATGAGDGALSGRDRPPPTPPIRASAEAPPVERFRAATAAYRAWARGHSHEFALLYGEPVPGYAAPESGETTRANTRVGAALGRPIVELALTGDLTPLPGSEEPEITAAMGPMLAYLPPVPDAEAVAATLMLAWSRIHGVVTLELNGQFRFLFGDDAAPLHDATVEALIEDLGFPRQAPR
jgi:AcrR family transcriptional regulator